MHRFLVIPAILCASISVAVGTSATAESADEPIPNLSALATPTAIQLDHHISWDDAVSLLEETSGAVGLRFTGAGAYGEAFGSDASELKQMKGSLLRDQGVLPPVTHILVGTDQERSNITENSLLTKSARLPESRPNRVTQGRLRSSADRVLGRIAESSSNATTLAADDGLGPQEWAPSASEIIATDGEVDEQGVPTSGHSVDMWMQWTTSSKRSPEFVPESWVLEGGIDTYADPEAGLNPTGLFDRPFCPRDANDAYFWSGYNPNFSIDPGGNFIGWTLSTLDQSLDPAAFGAYLDFNLALDACDRKSISIGIAHPQNAPLLTASFPNSRGFISTIYMPQGFADSSRFTSSYQLVSNDCGGGEVTTNCTGINSSTGGEPPNGYDPSSLVVGVQKNYRVPGCYFSTYNNGSFPEICY